MAGDWIKMRNDLADDPAVIGIAGKVGLDEFAVIGRLQYFWAWADRQSRDGHASGVTKTWIDRKVQCDGFAEAMESVNWLEISADGINIPKFDSHNGEPAKVRALGKNRKQKSRSNTKSVTPPVTLDEGQMSLDERDKSVTREEKRREDSKPIKSKTKAPAASSFDPKPDLFAHGVAEQTIVDWLALRAKKRAPVTPTVLSRLLREAAAAGMSLDATLALCCVRGWTGFEAAWVQKDSRGASAKFNATAHVNRNRKSNP